jgi:hypothetical protein
MLTLNYNNFKVNLYTDFNYKYNSSDNLNNYNHIYTSEIYYDYSAKIGIQVLQDDNVINSAILIAGYHDQSVSEDIVVIDGSNLLVAIGQHLFCLGVESLNLNWKLQVDEAFCFKIYNMIRPQ